MTCTNEYRPIPEGFIAIADYAKEHGLDLVQLACAVFRGDMKGWRWMLKKGQGTKPCDTVVIVVAEDDIAPAYIERRAWKETRRQASRRTLNRFSMAQMARLMGVPPKVVYRWVDVLELPKGVLRSQEEFDRVLARLKAYEEETRAARAERRARRRYVPKVEYHEAPEGYEAIRDCAKRLGVAAQSVHVWVHKGHVPSVESGGRFWVPKGIGKPNKMYRRAAVAD